MIIWIAKQIESGYDYFDVCLLKGYTTQEAAQARCDAEQMADIDFNAILPRLNENIKKVRERFPMPTTVFPIYKGPQLVKGLKMNEQDPEAKKQRKAFDKELAALQAAHFKKQIEWEKNVDDAIAEMYVTIGLTPEQILRSGPSPWHVSKGEYSYEVEELEIEWR